MNWTAFEQEVRRVLRTNYKIPELTDETPLDGVDSLGLVEIITASEEHLGVSLAFEKVRACQTYAGLKAVIESEAAP